ncbi:FAD-linked reductases C-terminal domain-containing protein [Lactarius deliciosus]|nr:FAD-linked reductases C-terminal domain-containing protein [Lactarius deliciosus]
MPGIMTLDSFANATFTSEQQVLFETNKAGAFTYSVGNIGMVTLQSMTTPSEFNAMRASLDQKLAARTLTALQKTQYQHLKKVEKKHITGDNTNIQDQPIIDPRIDDLRWDFDVLYYGTKFPRKWIQTKPLTDLIDEWITPLDAEWEKSVKPAVRTTNHPLDEYVSTIAMAPRSLGGKELPLTLVVNSDHLSSVFDLKMKTPGLTNVRVVDASVIPLTAGVAVQSD